MPALALALVALVAGPAAAQPGTMPEVVVYDVLAAESGPEVVVLLDRVSVPAGPALRTLVRAGPAAADYPDPGHDVVQERTLSGARRFTLVSMVAACEVTSDLEVTLSSGWRGLSIRTDASCRRGGEVGGHMPFRALDGGGWNAHRLISLVPMPGGTSVATDFSVAGHRFFVRRVGSADVNEVRCAGSLGYRREGAYPEVVLELDDRALVLFRSARASTIGSTGIRAPHCP